MKSIFLLIFIVFLSKISFCQKLCSGYIVTLKGDTINGQVEFEKYLTGYAKSSIKAFYDSAGSKYAIGIKDIFGYGFYRTNEQRHFSKIKAHDFISTTKFIEQYIFGKISVYVDEVVNAANLNTNPGMFWTGNLTNFKFYIRKDTGAIQFLNMESKKKVKLILGNLMADCPKYANELNRKLYAEEIYNLILSYNKSFCFNNNNN
jgi:hypothetical protein